ncbi:MAG TPA: hypothetical protein VGQ83_06725, partial [Polyangia bacterium]
YAGEVGDGLVRLLRRSLIFGGAVGLFELGTSLPTPSLGAAVVIPSFALAAVAFGFALWDTAGAEAAAQRAHRRRALAGVALAPARRRGPRGATRARAAGDLLREWRWRRYRATRCTTVPSLSRTTTSIGIVPGRLWVAQEKQGS